MSGQEVLSFVLADNVVVKLLLDLTGCDKLLRLDGAHLALLIGLLFFSYDPVSRSDAIDTDVAINT